MPLYEVEHCILLGKAERDEIARAITHLHTQKFSTPSLFVNVRFTNIKDHFMYVAGKPRTINRIIAFVRAGGPRTVDSFGDLAEEIIHAWNRIINDGKKGHGDREMKVVSILGSISAGIESGFLLPPAGGDAAWLNDNRSEFDKLASEGDPDFVNLLYEMQNREDLVQALKNRT